MCPYLRGSTRVSIRSVLDERSRSCLLHLGGVLGYSLESMRLVLALSLLAAAPVSAQVRPQPEVELRYQSLSAVRVNPLGLVSFLDLTARVRLHRSEPDALAQNYAGIGMTGGVSPAWGRVGVLAELQPLTLLRIYASYELVGYFSTFNLFASFPSASAEYSDTALRERTNQAGLASYDTYGGLFTLGSLVQAKIGPIAARNQLRAMHSSFDMRAGDRVYYCQLSDILAPNDGWLVIDEVDLLGVFDFGLAIGARYTYTHAFYDGGHYDPAEDPSAAPDNDIHRLGLLAAWTIEDNGGARFDRPTVILIAQWHLVHRYRTGADVTVGLPYLALGFQFTGDLLSDR